MRASENKAKTPSEYENPFFKRGKPELLWLITKPRPSKKKTKGTDQDQDTDDDEVRELEEGTKETTATTGPSKGLDLVTLPRSQLSSFQQEIDQLKRSQNQINSMIARFQHENNQYIRQASAQHERHENSINAILTFLATFYSRSVEGNGGNNPLLPGAIPNTQRRGNVVEEEYEEPATSPPNQVQRRPKQPLAILPPPSMSPTPKVKSKSATPEAPSGPMSQQPGSPSHLQPPQHQAHQGSHLRNSISQAGDSSAGSTPSPHPSGSPTTPSFSSNTLADNTVQDSQAHQVASAGPYSEKQAQQNQQMNTNNDIMSVINNTNAANKSSTPSGNDDFSSALRNLESANNSAGPLTPEQRNNVLSLMASTSGANTPTIANSLLNTSGNFDPSSYFDLNNSNANQISDLQQYDANRANIDALQRLQQEQDSKVSDLAGRLQPLSPNGAIPGLDMGFLNSNHFGGGISQGIAGNGLGDFDPNAYLNSEYFPDTSGEAFDNNGNAVEGGDGAMNSGLDFGDTNIDGNDPSINQGFDGFPQETGSYLFDFDEDDRHAQGLGESPNQQESNHVLDPDQGATGSNDELSEASGGSGAKPSIGFGGSGVLPWESEGNADHEAVPSKRRKIG